MMEEKDVLSDKCKCSKAIENPQIVIPQNYKHLKNRLARNFVGTM